MKASETIAKLGHSLAKSNVNSVCPWFFYTPKVPEKVKKLKKL